MLTTLGLSACTIEDLVNENVCESITEDDVFITTEVTPFAQETVVQETGELVNCYTIGSLDIHVISSELESMTVEMHGPGGPALEEGWCPFIEQWNEIDEYGGRLSYRVHCGNGLLGLYEFDISVIDRCGNSIQQYAKLELYCEDD